VRIVMSIVLPTNEYWNNEIEKNISLPIIFVDGASEVYLLISDISEKLEEYILTGKTTADELHVLADKQEQAMVSRWEEMGFMVTYRSQKISYMHRSVAVIYPQISKPAANIKISLLPWFMLPSRPYPVFVYIYAVWHYHSAEKKSQKETAAATGKLFGIRSFNKSTVSRSIKIMENIIDLAGIDKPLAVDEPKLPSDSELFEHIPKILNGFTTIEEIKEQYGEAVKRLPTPINGGGLVQRVLSGIPAEYSKIITPEREPVKRRFIDMRKRPPRRRNREKGQKPKPIVFVDDAQIRKTRNGFIKICRRLVLNSVVTYHTYLI